MSRTETTNNVASISLSTINIRKCLWAGFLLFSIAGLLSAYFRFGMGHDFVFGFVPKFNLDGENTLPTYYSSLMLLLAGMILLVISRAKIAENAGERKLWFLLALVFLFLSIDEAASLHELLIEPLRQTFGLGGAFYFSWVLVGLMFVVVLAVMYLQFLLSLPVATRNRFFVAAVLFISGALGVEMLGGMYAQSTSQHDLVYGVITAFEEMLELAGISLFIDALLRYMQAQQISLHLHLSS